MSDSLNLTRLLTNKRALGESRIDTLDMPLALAEGDVILKIDRVTVTTNNITYAAFGDAMQYWGFFPTGEPDWGHMPVWGFADVIRSNAEGVKAGERFYGYYPVASHIKMKAVRVKRRGFYDGSEHRLSPASAYNQYMRCSADPAYRHAMENYQMLVRPLFITSFMGADFLVYDCFAGSAQNTSFLRDIDLPGLKPEIYFVPVQIRKRNNDWGHDLVNQRFNAAQLDFIGWVSDEGQLRMEVAESEGYEQARRLIKNLHDGWIDPHKGHVVLLDQPATKAARSGCK
jgi:hypothetical protein